MSPIWVVQRKRSLVFDHLSEKGVPPPRPGRCSAGPTRRAARPKPPLSIASPPAAPPLFPRELPPLAQSHLEKHQEHNRAKTERDQRDGEHLAGQPTDQGGADRTSDNERRGRSKRQEARTGRHHRKVSLRLAAEQITVARNGHRSGGQPAHALRP